MSLSLCMIVKNEERVLRRCLESIKDAVDEIVVVDTGSEDNTREIARKYTDKVYNFLWQDDFSGARNFSFSKARGDYIMWLDADDVVEEKDCVKIKNLMKEPECDVYMCLYNMGFDSSFYRERILKRDKNFLWQGFVHEVIAPVGRISYTDIEIMHKKEEGKNSRRNLDIYLKKLKEGYQFNSRELYYYGRELYYNGLSHEAVEILEKYLEKSSYKPDYIGAKFLLADCYFKKAEEERALSCLYDTLRILPTSEACCRIGDYFYNKDLNRAEFWYKCALECERCVEKVGFYNKKYELLYPCTRLVELFEDQGLVELAQRYRMLARLGGKELDI